jgi:hypothetical protein
MTVGSVTSRVIVQLQVLFTLWSVTAYVYAQEKAAMYIGPFDVTPSIDVDVQNDDNLFEATSGNEVSSTLTLIKPSISAVADDGVIAYTIEYNGENGTYSDTDNNDYTDHEFSANVDWQIDIRHLLELSTTIQKAHEGRTQDSVTDFNATDLNEFTDKGLAANYTFGSEGARGRIQIGLEKSSLRYDTNLLQTAILESDTDVKTIDFSVGFTPSTRLTFQVSETENTFRNNAVGDRVDLSYLVGAAWEFTGITKGDVRFGRTNNDLLNIDGGDTSTSTWNASIEWLPKEYSTFTLTANKSIQNTDNGVGDFVDMTDITIDWNYQWNDWMTMVWSLQQQESDFAGTDRNDESQTFTVEFIYAMRRWLNLSIALGQQDLRSSFDENNFDKNTATFSIRASL